MPKFYKYTISNLLIIISIIFTIIGYFKTGFSFEWSINNFYIDKGDYIHWITQFFSGTFIHSGILHLFMNAVFIYYFGNILEIILGKTKYILFFILFVIFNGIALYYLSPNSYTIGISGFALAIITYYTLELKQQNNPEYKGGITAIIINIAIGFYPGISLIGHINGIIFGIIYFYLTNDFFKRQLVGLFSYPKSYNKVENLGTFNTKKD